MLARALAIAAAALALAACGSSGTSGGGGRPRDAFLLLDFTPNAAHAGIYAAAARGDDAAHGVKLSVRAPSQSTDSVKLLASGRVRFAVLDIHDLALARARGRDFVGVFALVQRPLAALIAQPGVRSPRDLAGRRVGVSGLPSDTAVLRSIVAGAGGDPGRVRQTAIGFDAVQALLSGKVAAATAFWNVEGVALRARRPGFRIFHVDDYGAPRYPELVVCATRRTLREEPRLVRGVVAALRAGYRRVIAHPQAGIDALLAANRGLDRTALEQQMRAIAPAFAPPGGQPGTLDASRLRAWARWEARFGIVRRPPDIRRAFVLSG